MASRPLASYRGSCHCGAVRFESETDFPELTTCDCSICRRRNALMVKVHESVFTLTIRSPRQHVWETLFSPDALKALCEGAAS